LPPAALTAAAGLTVVRAAAPVPPRRWRRAVVVGTGTVAVGFGVAAAILAHDASAAGEDVARVMNTGGPWTSAAMARERDGLRDEKLALCFGAAALLSAAIATWLLLRREGPRP